MSIADYSNGNFALVINGRQITDFGDTASPFVDAPIDPKRALRRGQGGNAIKLERSNPGRMCTLYLNPGSPDSAYMQGLFNSGANISLSRFQVGTLESSIGTDGVIVNDAAMNRAGTTISDDQYIIEFNGWTGLKGS